MIVFVGQIDRSGVAGASWYACDVMWGRPEGRPHNLCSSRWVGLRRRSAHWPPPRSCTPTGPTDADSLPLDWQKPWKTHVPTEWNALAVRIAPPPWNVPFPRTWMVSVLTVDPSQVNN